MGLDQVRDLRARVHLAFLVRCCHIDSFSRSLDTINTANVVVIAATVVISDCYCCDDDAHLSSMRLCLRTPVESPWINGEQERVCRQCVQVIRSSRHARALVSTLPI